ncbi:ubiquitin fusion degradation protein 2 [Purpureocillium lavendulum]|uniref:Ubiquitin fusion degradation protein 2 n=1 Tax=Purpureocillium lavendulum TaxID=1247861 RepID=A0AB34FM87_9HYPO|nr:ubiquitin fusion degradation protein 2 [Purpureocillium lavendulum]
MDPNEERQMWPDGDAPDKQKMDQASSPSWPWACGLRIPNPRALQIRARRLAKLGSAAPKPAENADKPDGSPVPSSSTTPTPTPKPQPTETPRSNITITPAPKPPAPGTNPFTQLGVQSSRKDSGSSSPQRKRTAAEVEDGRAATTTPPPAARSKPAPAAQAESDEDYAHRVLTQVFRITLDPHHMKSSTGQRLIFVPTLNQELNESGEPLKLSVNVLDQAIIEACGTLPMDSPLFGYLLPCWKRAVKAHSMAKNVSAARLEVLDEAKRLCMSNCLFSLTMPVLYGSVYPRFRDIYLADLSPSREPNGDHDSLVPYLLRGITEENGLDFEFIREAIKRFDDDEAFPALFNDAMVSISTRLSALSLGDDYKPYIQALLTYTRFPILISNLAQHPCFNMAQSAPGIERHTILGPFFRISPLQPEAIKSYFPGPRSLDRTRIANAQDSLRLTLRAHQDDLFVIANSFIRAGPETRSLTLNWFAYIMNMNHKRRAMQVDPREVSSDGFMLNVTAVMDRFCEPFMDNDFSKVDKIDVKYFKRQPRVDIKDETKLNADQATADKYYAEKEEGESNFISEAFFLTLAAHHYGSEALNSQLKNIDREIKYLEKNIKAMEAERPKVANSPHQLRLFEETLRRHTNVLEKTIALKYAIEGALLDERMQSTSLRFMRYVAVWLLRLVTGSDYKPGKEIESIKLPLSAEHSEAFACLPEYALQNIVDNFKFVFRWLPKILPSAVGEEMIALCITFLRSSEFIKNPYLKSSLVSLLFSGTWPFMHLKKGVLGDQLISLPFANEYLLRALMKFYIECESTGGNAFYDKFNIRYEIFQVIKTVWINDVYKQQLSRESKVNRSFFVQFVNMLLNDATYVLDEAFTKFPKMRTLERELEDPSLSAEDRQKKEEELQTLGNQATSYMQLANETLEMMKLFTKALSESFTMPEIVSRLASMLNYNLETLAGKKAAAELSVSNKDKYHFRPIQLISDFVDIYLNLGYSPVFVEAVAADGRSYKPEVLDRVTRILTSKNAKDAADIAKWEKIKAKFLDAKHQLDQAEVDLGDIPAEFEDPIMGDLMKDPVLLPSKHIVDRSTIVQHLLSDPKDPFTRQPMTVDDAIPQTELKEKIEGWRAERIAEARAKTAGDDAMDTAED